VGFGLIVPVLPYYAQRFGANGLGYGAIIGVFSLMQFLATMILGRLSDRIGRRPILLTSIAVGMIGYLMFAAAGSYVVLSSRGSWPGRRGNISVAQAYIADVTTPAHVPRHGAGGCGVRLGFVVGPALGGLVGGFVAPRPWPRGGRLCAITWSRRDHPG